MLDEVAVADHAAVSSTCWCSARKRNIGPRRKRSTNSTIECSSSSRFSSGVPVSTKA